jgi:hypothetical protein
MSIDVFTEKYKPSFKILFIYTVSRTSACGHKREMNTGKRGAEQINK